MEEQDVEMTLSGFGMMVERHRQMDDDSLRECLRQPPDNALTVRIRPAAC